MLGSLGTHASPGMHAKRAFLNMHTRHATHGGCFGRIVLVLVIFCAFPVMPVMPVWGTGALWCWYGGRS